MTDIKELKEEELKQVSGGMTIEEIYNSQDYQGPKISAILGDGQPLSMTHEMGCLFDSTGKEFRLTSFSNSADGLSTTYFFVSMDQSQQYVKTVSKEDNVISNFSISR